MGRVLEDGRRELELGRLPEVEGLDGIVGLRVDVEGREGVAALIAVLVLPNCTESPSMAESACCTASAFALWRVITWVLCPDSTAAESSCSTSILTSS